MKRDFLNELKTIIDKNKINEKEVSYYKEETPKYNIYKRSLPIGLDKVVLVNVSKEEADWWLTNKLKTKEFDDYVIYFDRISVGASDKEKNVLFNKGELTI